MESCECHVISSHFREESDKSIVSLYLQSWSQTIIWEWSGVWLYWIHCLLYNGLFSWGANFHYFCCSPVTKFSTHENLPSRFLHMLKFSGPAMFCYGSFCYTRASLTVSLIHRVPFLSKLSRVWWLRKWTENCRRQKHNQKKTGPVPLVQR